MQVFPQLKKIRFFKPKLSIEHVSWRGKQILYHMSHPWLQTCHTPATYNSRSIRTVQTGRQQSYVTHFRSIVSGVVMDVSVCLFAECIDSRAQSGPIPWFMSTPLKKKIESERCRVIKIMGKMTTRWQITCSSWPTCNVPWWIHSGCPFKANQQRNEYSGGAWAGKRNVARVGGGCQM